MKIYILQTVFSDYDAHDVDIKGITTNPEYAEAWRWHNAFVKNEHYSDEVIEQELDALPLDVLKDINTFLNSPFCECGHRKSHHLKGPKNTRCRHNHKEPYQTQEVENGPIVDVLPHQCMGFVERKP
jgi:hypothetical protein